MESASSAISTFVFWGIALGAVLYAIIIYNNLVNLKHAVSKTVHEVRAGHAGESHAGALCRPGCPRQRRC